MSVNKTVTEAASILEYLFENDFKAKSVSNISAQFETSPATVYRILQSWKQAGWVVEIPSPNGRGVLWMCSNKLVSISFAYDRHTQEKYHSLKNEYQSTTGKEFQA